MTVIPPVTEICGDNAEFLFPPNTKLCHHKICGSLVPSMHGTWVSAGNPRAPPRPLPSGVGNLRWSPVLDSCTSDRGSKTLSQTGSASPCPKHDTTSLQICSDTPALQWPAENHSRQVSSMTQLKTRKSSFPSHRTTAIPCFILYLGKPRPRNLSLTRPPRR